MDGFYIAIAAAFAVGSWGLIVLCDRLQTERSR